MAFSYDGSQLADSPLFQVRFALGDTVEFAADGSTEIFLLNDEEIEAMIQMHGQQAAIGHCARNLAIRFANQPDEYTDEGGVKVTWKDRVKAWLELAKAMDAIQQDTEMFGSPETGSLSTPDTSALRL